MGLAQKLDPKLRCMMKQFIQPVEGQNGGQETVADHPVPIKAGRSRLDAPLFPRFVV